MSARSTATRGGGAGGGTSAGARRASPERCAAASRSEATPMAIAPAAAASAAFSIAQRTSLARLGDRRTGQADDLERRQPVRDIDLDGHERGLEAPERAGGDAGHAHGRRRGGQHQRPTVAPRERRRNWSDLLVPRYRAD